MKGARNINKVSITHENSFIIIRHIKVSAFFCRSLKEEKEVRNVEIVIVGIITVIATLLGACVGARYSYKGAMDAVTKQMQFQLNLLKDEEVKNNKIACEIITKLLWNEIEYNCRMFDGVSKSISTDWFLREKPTQYSYGNYKFVFDDYNGIKYELLKYNSGIVQDVIEIYYKLFLLNAHKDLNELSQEEFERVKNLYVFKDKIKNLIETKYKGSQ